MINIDYPVQHAGVNRVANGLAALASFSITRSVIHGLAVLGSPLTRAFGALAAARKQRREDEKLWDIALTDARVMADLSRAMSKDAQRDVRGYY
ncbi:MAG TPA: hypothetical protein VHL79_06190 [Ramlibacter sp.]|nr:hypothetical protein [Ramlibacter sp.]